MDTEPQSDAGAEELRIRAAYARRSLSDPRYAWSNPGYVFMMQERERSALALLRRHAPAPIHELKVLDLGCGTGQWIRQLVTWGVRPDRIVGIDLLEDRIAEARRLCAPGVELRSGSALEADVEAEAFDVVVQATVLTSVLDEGVRRGIAAQVLRALRPGGVILWYDFFVGNPRNPDVRPVTRSDLVRLFPGCRMHLTRTTLAPPIAMRLAPVSWMLCAGLSRIGVLCTHYMGVIRKV